MLVASGAAMKFHSVYDWLFMLSDTAVQSLIGCTCSDFLKIIFSG